jgi:hypothetical protein
MHVIFIVTIVKLSIRFDFRWLPKWLGVLFDPTLNQPAVGVSSKDFIR